MFESESQLLIGINNLKIKIPNGFEYLADVRSETFISI